MRPPKIVAICDACLTPIEKGHVRKVDVFMQDRVQLFDSWRTKTHMELRHADLCPDCFPNFYNKVYPLMKAPTKFTIVDTVAYEARLNRIAELEKQLKTKEETIESLKKENLALYAATAPKACGCKLDNGDQHVCSPGEKHLKEHVGAHQMQLRKANHFCKGCPECDIWG